MKKLNGPFSILSGLCERRPNGFAMSRKRRGATSRYRLNQAAPFVASIAVLGDARKPSDPCGSRSMIAEKQTITVNVFDHETPETITASVRQGH